MCFIANKNEKEGIDIACVVCDIATERKFVENGLSIVYDRFHLDPRRSALRQGDRCRVSDQLRCPCQGQEREGPVTRLFDVTILIFSLSPNINIRKYQN